MSLDAWRNNARDRGSVPVGARVAAQRHGLRLMPWVGESAFRSTAGTPSALPLRQPAERRYATISAFRPAVRAAKCALNESSLRGRFKSSPNRWRCLRPGGNAGIFRSSLFSLRQGGRGGVRRLQDAVD
jgi:hypothetical protein